MNEVKKKKISCGGIFFGKKKSLVNIFVNTGRFNIQITNLHLKLHLFALNIYKFIEINILRLRHHKELYVTSE